MNKVSRIISPSSIALIGVSSDLQKNSGRLFANLINTKFEGEIYVVNPNYSEILHMNCYPSILEINEAVDLACIISPPETVVNIVKECIEKNVKSIVVLSEGFSEDSSLINGIQKQLLEVVEGKDVVLYGPNTQGVSLYHEKWGLSCAPIYESKKFKEGKIGLISTGDIGQSIVESNQKGIGFSYWFSPGSEIDISVEDCLEFLIEHDKTEVILLIVKEVNDKQRFRQLLQRAFEKNKPIIYFTTEPNYVSHTCPLPLENEGEICEFEDFSGLLKVNSIHEMVSLAWLFDQSKQIPFTNTLVYTWSTSIANYIKGLCKRYNLHLPVLSQALHSRLRKVNDVNGHFRNPVDLSAAIYKDLDSVTDSLKMIVDSKEFTVFIIVIPFQLSYQNEVIVRNLIELNSCKEILFVPLFLSQGINEELASELIKESTMPYFYDEHITLKSLATYLRYHHTFQQRIFS